MKVYLGFTDKEHDSYLQFLHYLEGLYPKDDLLWVTDSPPDAADLWGQMDAHDIAFEHIYEINLPHSAAAGRLVSELARQRVSV